ncbi:EboA domain-containing protein [Pedobacter africanus]|uniref:Uncharacterized protein n=1 Tax=Pedobacter africanus TaxID=151894 RepID=A0A1W2ATW6_9SPHI|nr:EboA domain-containing protein [Pedobacter africanus]SMC63638.1 hypothetical protein SAMN04488524_1628 [Pedobacter africanus]
MLLIDSEGLKSLNGLFLQIIERSLTAEAFQWLQNKAGLVVKEDKSVQLHLCFAHLPRIASRELVMSTDDENTAISALLPGFTITDWTSDKLCRIWLLMQLPSDNRETYVKKINSLFSAAEMNEQVALYSALPLYLYPEEWISRCEEGIRSNIGTVLEAIMYHNPYPARFLSQQAWNQLVLKAFFTEKDVKQIVGLNERLNESLTATLQDYVQERLAAQRSVAPEIYQLIEQMNQKI